jgi:hypothetical protein
LDAAVGVTSEVRDLDGRRVALDDPLGGTFDAAGDFDRVIPADRANLPARSSIDPYGEWVVPVDRLGALADEVAALRGDAKPGPEDHGLIRLEKQIEACLSRPDLRLILQGD